MATILDEASQNVKSNKEGEVELVETSKEGLENQDLPNSDDNIVDEDQQLKSDEEKEPKPKNEKEVPKTNDEDEEQRSESSSSDPSRAMKNILRIVLAICQTVILGIGVGYIYWWPENINIFSNERDGSESLGDTADEEILLQKWQASYLGLSLLFTYYGCWAEDRGWLMLSMFLNIGIMSLFPLRNFGSEMPFTLMITIFAVISVYVCYMLSERVQDSHLQDYHVAVAQTKKQCLFFDLPDMTVYHMGVLQTLTAFFIIFLGLAWMMVQEQMITLPVRDQFSCSGWPDEQCGRYYGLQAQEYYVGRLAVTMLAAGGVGVVGGFFRHRTLLIFAMVLTIVPFFGIIENGIYTMGTAEDVRFMCSDEWWVSSDRVGLFWGEDWDCATQETYHTYSVVFMILCSSFSLFHLWLCLRFSEKLQSWEHAQDFDVDVNLGDNFRCICNIPQPMKLYKTSMTVLSWAVVAGGIAQIYYGVSSDNSTQTEVNYNMEQVVVLDSASYIDTPLIYGIFAILIGLLTLVFAFVNSRAILSLVFCLLIESIAIGVQNCLWHQIDLEYGIVQLSSDIQVWPLYINDDARDLLHSSILWYRISLGASILMLFFCVMTHEAAQDVEKMINNDADKWIVKVGTNSIKL